jgi:hypothetical protein
MNPIINEPMLFKKKIDFNPIASKLEFIGSVSLRLSTLFIRGSMSIMSNDAI